MEPHDDHPLYNPQTDLFWSVFESAQSIAQAFRAEELDMAYGITPSGAERIEEEMGESAMITRGQGWTPHTMLAPQYPIAPTKFREFRMAVGKSVDRRKLNQVVWRGTNTEVLTAEVMLDPHPFRPPEERITQIVEDPTGEPDQARQLLEDNGWGWDDDGNLHYPPDADLTPLWPEGEQPTSSTGFECLDNNGEWVHPDDR
jgi:peptide/nickel transport system substrate-binding protein